MIESLVLSKLYYCSTVWANTSDSNIKKLQLVQIFAARIITGARKYDHITPYLQQLGWLSVKDHISYRDFLVMFKCINGMAPEYLSKNFSTRSSVHDRETRNRNNLENLFLRQALGRGPLNTVQQSYWTNLTVNSKILVVLSFLRNNWNNICCQILLHLLYLQ